MGNHCPPDLAFYFLHGRRLFGVKHFAEFLSFAEVEIIVLIGEHLDCGAEHEATIGCAPAHAPTVVVLTVFGEVGFYPLDAVDGVRVTVGIAVSVVLYLL